MNNQPKFKIGDVVLQLLPRCSYIKEMEIETIFLGSGNPMYNIWVDSGHGGTGNFVGYEEEELFALPEKENMLNKAIEICKKEGASAKQQWLKKDYAEKMEFFQNELQELKENPNG